MPSQRVLRMAKIFKKLLETSKICEFPSLDPENRAQHPQNTHEQRQTQSQKGSRKIEKIQEEPLLTEGL